MLNSDYDIRLLFAESLLFIVLFLSRYCFDKKWFVFFRIFLIVVLSKQFLTV